MMSTSKEKNLRIHKSSGCRMQGVVRRRAIHFLDRIARTTYVDAVYCYRPSSVVCQSVTLVSPAKTAEQIEMPFGWALGWTQGTMFQIPHEKGQFGGKGAKSLDRGFRTDIAIFDFSKAFNSVPHCCLFSKLNQYGICGTVQNWLHSFLSDRYQRIMLNGAQSSWLPVLSGVPQGTVFCVHYSSWFTLTTSFSALTQRYVYLRMTAFYIERSLIHVIQHLYSLTLTNCTNGHKNGKCLSMFPNVAYYASIVNVDTTYLKLHSW